MDVKSSYADALKAGENEKDSETNGNQESSEIQDTQEKAQPQKSKKVFSFIKTQNH